VKITEEHSITVRFTEALASSSERAVKITEEHPITVRFTEVFLRKWSQANVTKIRRREEEKRSPMVVNLQKEVLGLESGGRENGEFVQRSPEF
jgi:hypothetical protein